MKFSIFWSLKNLVTQTPWAVGAELFDQVAKRYIARHQESLVIELGAALSTHYSRVGQDCWQWIKLDLPLVTKIQRQLDTKTEQHRFISSSVMDFGWIDALAKILPERVLLSTEGLLMYFEQVQQLIKQMRSRFPGATFMF